MATNRTFTMIKPDATGAGGGKIIDRIIGAFHHQSDEVDPLNMDDAAAFYAVLERLSSVNSPST